MKKRILVSTGGSGGHVIPATILYDHLSASSEVTIATDKRGSKYLNEKTFNFEIINTPKLNNIFFLPLNLIITLFLIFKSLFLLKNKKIDKLISTGGYMSLPPIVAAKILNLEIYLFEPNQILGRSNRYFLRLCKKIICYTDDVKNFPTRYKDKIEVIDCLVRKKFYEIQSYKKDNKRFNLMILGGSQGASVFDKDLQEIIFEISKKNYIKIFQQTSKSNIMDLKDYYSKKNIENTVFNFDENLINHLYQSDLCITRAGASILSELSVLNIPFIAVPLPSAKDNHQFENANFYKQKNCCWIIDQSYLKDEIEKILSDIMKNNTDLIKKKENLKKLNYQNTWINVNQKLLSIINEN